MSHAADLLLFAALVFGIIALPGLDMAFVLGSSLTAGRRQGLTAVAGITVGGAGLVAMTTLGIGVLLKVVPAAFNALLLAGALYIAWIGISLLRADSAFGMQAEGRAVPAWTTFRRGALTCLLNPKAYLFMLAVFPQFLHAAYGPLWSQALVLWLIIAITQLTVYGSIALAASRARGWLVRQPAAGAVVARAVGVMLIGAALFTGFEGWRAM
ncbi:MAG: LysE family translocator [Xanthomonadales bacterium]|nr:LysE family translocator [Xanthomonadales bacterium]ODU92719.1 MAG: threonine transporter RhtB [Rhodanobacter sp. SCN 66-43]OJY83917.1 MAG: threonine transporter RhtB [Xanthomonadales bacterium 66-474]